MGKIALAPVTVIIMVIKTPCNHSHNLIAKTILTVLKAYSEHLKQAKGIQDFLKEDHDGDGDDNGDDDDNKDHDDDDHVHDDDDDYLVREGSESTGFF